MTPHSPHLGPDDLDALHAGSLGSVAQLHLETCDECRRVAAADREVIASLAEVPFLAPASGFADRVMARVRVDRPAPVPVLSFPELTRGRRIALGTVAAALAASVALTAIFRPAIEAGLAQLARDIGEVGWAVARGFTTQIAAQPWFEDLRSTWLAPARLVPLGLAGLLAYASGLLLLRRLVTPSRQPVSNANA
jgi:hypothetical protein